MRPLFFVTALLMLVIHCSSARWGTAEPNISWVSDEAAATVYKYVTVDTYPRAKRVTLQLCYRDCACGSETFRPPQKWGISCVRSMVV